MSTDNIKNKLTKNYTRVEHKAVTKDELLDREILVYHVLLLHRNEKTKTAYPSWDTIKQIASIGKDTIQEALEGLQTKGYIVITKEKRVGAKHEHNVYSFPKYKLTLRSEKMPNVILLSDTLNSTEKTFLLRLLPMTFEDLSFKRTRKELADEMGISESTVKRVMKSLGELEFIVDYCKLIETGRTLKSGKKQTRSVKYKQLNPTKWLEEANYIVTKQAQTIEHQKNLLRAMREENERLRSTSANYEAELMSL